MATSAEDHECDLAAHSAKIAGSRLYGVEGLEAGSPEDALKAVLNIERYLRQAQRHIDRFKARMANEHGLDESDFTVSPVAADSVLQAAE